MRKLSALAAAVILAATPAVACKCAPDGQTSELARVLSDPSVSVVDVFVQIVDDTNGLATLDIKAVHHGKMQAPHVQAKFGATSCDIRPLARSTMMLVVRAEAGGTYSIVGDCAYDAVLGHFGRKRYSAARVSGRGAMRPAA